MGVPVGNIYKKKFKSCEQPSKLSTSSESPGKSCDSLNFKRADISFSEQDGVM